MQNVNEIYFDMIFKRKSFHLFRNTLKLEQSELSEIEEKVKTLTPLYPDIKTDIKVVAAEETSCKRGEEYCILFYSEKKENYLQNIGFIGEQLDLYLASKDIGSLWFGIGKPKEPEINGLDFVIMLAIAKTKPDKFRKDMFKSKRKPIDEIWQGEAINNVTEIVRFAPSACNTQPWIVENSGKALKITRYKKPGKRVIMPKNKVVFYNRIDIGIFLCFLEISLKHENISFERKLFCDRSDDDTEKTLTAEYKLNI